MAEENISVMASTGKGTWKLRDAFAMHDPKQQVRMR
jgi:hypothetical protein